MDAWLSRITAAGTVQELHLIPFSSRLHGLQRRDTNYEAANLVLLLEQPIVLRHVVKLK
jgi:hypothetical protein